MKIPIKILLLAIIFIPMGGVFLSVNSKLKEQISPAYKKFHNTQMMSQHEFEVQLGTFEGNDSARMRIFENPNPISASATIEYVELKMNWNESNSLMDVLHKAISKTKWVKATLVGRLGNQLFITASSYGIAKARNAKWCIEPLHNPWMNLEEKVEWIEEPEECPSSMEIKYINENGKFASFVENMVYDYIDENVHVGTYLNSFKYWNTIVPFKLKKKEWGAQWTREHNVKVGIHIRRTDYYSIPEYRKNLPPDVYYEFGIQYIMNMTNHTIPKESFWVTSDDMDWVRNNGIFNGMQQSTFVEADEVMSVLNACIHMISGSGSFSWWSMYMMPPSLEDKRIQLYYYHEDYLFMPGDITLGDYFPAYWTGVEVKDNRAMVV